MYKKIIFFIILCLCLVPIFVLSCFGFELDSIGSYLSGVGTFGLFGLALLFGPDKLSEFIQSTRFNKKANAISEIFEDILKYEDELKVFKNATNNTEATTAEEIFRRRFELLDENSVLLKKNLRIAKTYLGHGVEDLVQQVLDIHKKIRNDVHIYQTDEYSLGKVRKDDIYNRLMDNSSEREKKIKEILLKLGEVNSKYWS